MVLEFIKGLAMTVAAGLVCRVFLVKSKVAPHELHGTGIPFIQRLTSQVPEFVLQVSDPVAPPYEALQPPAPPSAEKDGTL